MLPDTDLQDSAALLPRKAGDPQSCSQFLHRAPLCMEARVLIGSVYHGGGIQWLSVPSKEDDNAEGYGIWGRWHPMRVTTNN